MIERMNRMNDVLRAPSIIFDSNVGMDDDVFLEYDPNQLFMM
jgi:hypothetical protein